MRTSAREHLARARQLREHGTPHELLYAALELRFAIEARLIEYTVADGDSMSFAGPWQVGHLKRGLDHRHTRLEKPIAVTFYDPTTNKPVVCEYTPVTEKLSKLAQKLGAFLHASATNWKQPNPTRKLADLVDQAIQGLALATRGTFLQPPSSVGKK